MKDRITKRLVDSLRVPEGADRTKVYDDLLTGFGVTAWASGKKVFFLEYGGRGQQRRMSLGDYGPLTVDAARDMAKVKLGEVVQGADPLAERAQRAATQTFSTWRDTYIDRIRRTKKQARHDERYLCAKKEPRSDKRGKPAREDDHIRRVAGEWSTKKLDQLSRSDVQAGMASIAEHGHTTANRWLASVRACLQAAVLDGLIRDNPAMGVKPFRESVPRARVLSDDELARVVAAFDDLADPHVRAAFVLLMDTGARKSEALSARWDDVDLSSGLWRIPSPKAGRPQTVPLAESTVAYLRGVERLGPFLVPGRNAAHPRTDLRRAWDRVREAAEVQDVNIHDLRRTFGLHIRKQAGLQVASKLLRHSDVRVTERVYAPLGMDELRSAVEDMHGARERIVRDRQRGTT